MRNKKVCFMIIVLILPNILSSIFLQNFHALLLIISVQTLLFLITIASYVSSFKEVGNNDELF